MKKILGLISLVLCCFILQSCEKETTEEDITIVGSWKVIATSGGLSGGGYTPKFNELTVDSDLKFMLEMNDSLIATGQINEISSQDFDYLVELIADDIAANGDIYILDDNEKYIEFAGDTLHLNSPCCDRFDTAFKKE